MPTELGKFLIFLGLFLIILGTLMILLPKLNLPLGNLPGDIKLKKENVEIYIPLASSLLVSLLLTVVLNIVFLLFRK